MMTNEEWNAITTPLRAAIIAHTTQGATTMTTTTRTRMQQALFDMFKDIDETEDETMSNLRHFFQHGDMTSGFGQLIYYSDTHAFITDHYNDVQAALEDMMDNSGYSTLAELIANNGYTKDAQGLAALNCGLVWIAAENAIHNMIYAWEISNDPQYAD